MNTVTSRLSRWVAGFIAVALIAGGSLIATTPALAAPDTASSSTLSWGFKSSWRSYIGFGGGVATASGGASKVNATPNSAYTWGAGATTYDATARSGSAQFAGTVRFENAAHGIDLSVSNPRVTFAGDGTGAIYWTGPTGDVLGATLAGVTTSDAVVSATQASVTVASTSAAFTEAGGSPFTYAAGTVIDNVAFTVSYALPAAATTTTLTVPATAIVNAATTVSATVAPANAVGSVEFRDGATSLATVPVASGAAATSATFTTAGAHSITAVFTPTDAAAFVGSMSTASTVTVSAAPVATTPTVVVSKSVVSDAGETITVTGSGFVPNAPGTTGIRAPLAGKFGGAYVSFGKFATVWKPSAGAASSARPVGPGGKWVVNAADVATIGSASGVAINPDGTFSVQLLVKPGYSGELANGNYGVYTYPGSGASYPAFETYTPITFAPTPTVTVSKTTLSSAGETVTVSGSGFGPVGSATTATRAPLAGKFGGVYVTFGRFADVWKTSAGALSSARAADRSTLKWVMNPADVAGVGGAAAGAIPINPDGTFSIDMLVKPGFSGAPATGNYGIYTYPGGGVSYPAFETATPIAFTTTPAPPVTPTTLALTASPATLAAGGSSTLSAQVSPSAAGTVTFVAGSTTLGSVAVSATGGASFTVDNLPAGVQQFSATFTPGDATRFGASSASAAVSVAAPAVVASGSLTWGVKESFRSYVTGPIAKGAVTTSGVASSGGIYTFGQSAGGDFDHATGVGSSNYSGSVRFSGHAGLLDVTLSNPFVRVDSATSGTLLVSVNGGASTPFATLNLAAGAKSPPNNTVSYAGVPAALTSQGAAVFSLNGSGFYDVGAALDPVSFVIGAPSVVSSPVGATVASFTAPKKAAPTAPASRTTAVTGCVVDDASITWGFKESFRAYISGSIAHGEWTVAEGATYTVPNFGWSAGAGGYDAETAAGLLAFAGSITFTGHGGVLNTTVSNPQISFVDKNTVVLLLDVSGTTQDGEAVDTPAVEFAELDLEGVVENDGGAVTITAAPAALTAAGAAAFGTYPAGEALDPVTIAFATAADCAVVADEAAQATTSSDSTTPTTEEAVSAEKPIDYGWIIWAVLALLLVAAAVVVTVVVRRRQA